MTQFNTLGPQLVRNIENAQDASVRTRFKRNQQLGQKKQQLDQKIASGASRTSLRDRRDRALIEQGVDPDRLRQGIRADRQDLNRTLRESRRAFQSGDTAQGEALRAQAEGLRRDINDRFKIVTPKLGDLPPEQQVAKRAAGQDQFNKSLAATAGLARQSATDAGAQQTQKLARIGEQAYRLENGGPPPAGTDPSVLAKYAITASPAVLDRVTRGVGLPADPTIAADANAHRLESLAAGGYTLPQRAPYTRTEDPALLDRFRLRQTDQALSEETGRSINRNVLQTAESQSRQGAVDATTAANTSERVGPLITENEQAVRKFQIAKTEGNLQTQVAQNEIDQIGNNKALDLARSPTQGSVADWAGLKLDTKNDVDKAIDLTEIVGPTLDSIIGKTSSAEVLKKLDSSYASIVELSLRRDISSPQKAILAQNILSQIRDFKNDGRQTALDSGYFIRDGAIEGLVATVKSGRLDGAQAEDTKEANRKFKRALDLLYQMASAK